MNDRPARWLAEPTTADEQALIAQFCAYGVQPSLLSLQTLTLLGDQFDRFAPLMIAAQTPPNAPNAGLQEWFRPRANEAQGADMRRALRAWLTQPGHDSPRADGRVLLTQSSIEAGIRKAQLVAAEALGDWRDREALPGLRALADSIAVVHPVVMGAIRRIEQPERPEVLAVRSDGRVQLGRRASEIDSLIIDSIDAVTNAKSTSIMDRRAIDRIWKELNASRVYVRGKGQETPDPGSVRLARVRVFFEDGASGRLEQPAGDLWVWEEVARPHLRVELAASALRETAVEELQRMGFAPEAPRFVGEWVTLVITSGELQVSGIYSFEGVPEDGWVPLLYPMASGRGQGMPRVEAVRLESSDHHVKLPVTFEQRDSTCRIKLMPGKVRSYQLRVDYRQPLTGRAARYITTSAREWGRPLHRAWFQVIMDATLGEPGFSESFREVGEGNGRRRFLFEAAPYRPEHDIVVTW